MHGRCVTEGCGHGDRKNFHLVASHFHAFFHHLVVTTCMHGEKLCSRVTPDRDTLPHPAFRIVDFEINKWSESFIAKHSYRKPSPLIAECFQFDDGTSHSDTPHRSKRGVNVGKTIQRKDDAFVRQHSVLLMENA